jgi:hypothetical protein
MRASCSIVEKKKAALAGEPVEAASAIKPD